MWRGWVYKRRSCSCVVLSTNSGTGLSQASKGPTDNYSMWNVTMDIREDEAVAIRAAIGESALKTVFLLQGV